MTERHDALAPFSAYPVIPETTIRTNPGHKGVTAIRESQVCDGQIGRQRELSSDTLSGWDDDAYWQDMTHLFNRTESWVPRPVEGLSGHAFNRGLSVSGYALTARGMLVQEMAVIAPCDDGRLQARSLRFRYGASVEMSCMSFESADCERAQMADVFLKVIRTAHDRLMNLDVSQTFDWALAQARSLDHASILEHWQTSRCLGALIRSGGPHPDAVLAF